LEYIEVRFGETFGQNLVRMAGTLNREAIKQLAPAKVDAKNIHEARLCFKRLRSLLRMARHGLDQGEFRRLNTYYRNQARALAGQRDHTVISETLKPIIKSRDSTEEKAFLIRFRARLQERRNKEAGKQNLESARSEVMHQLTKMQAQLTQWKVIEDKPELFFLGVQTTYGQARKELAQLKSDMSDHMLHEWRKHVKYLWHQMEMLLPIWPVMLKAWVKESKTLSQLLGRHHDLVLVETALREYTEPELEDLALTTFQDLGFEKSRIERDALNLGAKLFSLRQANIYRMLSECIPDSAQNAFPD